MKEFVPFRLDTENQCLWCGSERIVVQPRAYAEAAELLEQALRRERHLSDEEAEAVRGELEQAREAMRS